MAGGQGKRIQSLFGDVPKPLIKIGDKSVLEDEIESLSKQGFSDILITLSYKAEQIMSYIGDGSSLGVNIEYYVEDKPLGNGGALFRIRDKLESVFLLINADSVFDIDLNRLLKYHHNKDALVTLVTHPNNHPSDSGLIIADEDKYVKEWLNKEDEHPQWYKNSVNAGIHVIDPIVLDMVGDKKLINKEGKIDLDRDILKPLCTTGKIVCYDTTEYIKDMGTPERYYHVCEDIKKGIVWRKNLINKQRAIFLDRDGTINKYVGFVRNIDEFELIDGVTEAIRLINESGYLAVVVTNQPVIARGEVSKEELQEIHNKMETLLGKDGAYVDAIYYCPHHPDIGFEGEIKELKTDCNCRKPKPGLLIRAAEELNIDLSQSWCIGDSERDVIAGRRAGCKTGIINSGDYIGQVDIMAESLNSIIKKILEI